MDDDPYDSNAHGIVATVLYTIFAIVGIILSFLISAGNMNTPIARSEFTPGCLASDKLQQHSDDIMFRALMAGSVYDTRSTITG